MNDIDDLRGHAALVTLSYRGDLELCRRLCASVDRHMPGIAHYLVIDRVDRALFEPLATGARRIVETETLLPELWQVTLFGRRMWLTPYGPPVRGWILQQLAKLAIANRLEEDVAVMVDSDAEFIRPLRMDELIRDGRVRLYRAPGAAQHDRHKVWHRVAARVLGLPPTDYFGADYITTAVTWSPALVRGLLARIRKSTRLPWRMALSWRFRFAEYILYGVFVDHAPGDQAERVFHDENDLCHCSWHYDLDDEESARAFVADLDPARHAAVLIQSNLKLPQARRDALTAALAARLEQQG